MNTVATFIPHNGGELVEPTTRKEIQLDINFGGNFAKEDKATTDEEAIQCYMAIRCTSPATKAAFLSDLRKLYWFIDHHCVEKREIKSFKYVSCQRMQIWLQNPLPSDCGSKAIVTLEDGRPNLMWRPLVKGLSANSANSTRSNLMAFWAWLVNTEYLIANPWKAIKPIIDKTKALRKRELPLEVVHVIKNYLNQMPEAKTAQLARSNALNRWLFWLFIMTGSRVTAMTNAKMSDIKNNKGGKVLSLLVKGGKYQYVQWPDVLDKEIKRFHAAYGLADSQDNHIIISAKSSKDQLKMTRNGMNRRIKKLFNEVANWHESQPEYDESDAYILDILCVATCHFIRHGMVSTMVNHTDGDIKTAQTQAGHSSSQTTEGYHKGDQEALTETLKQLEKVING